jgi:serine/threonine protein kinase
MELKDLIIKCLDVNPCTRPTFQDMKSYSFIRKITGERNPSMSLHDLRYIPTFQSRQSEEVHHKEQPITSLRALDNIQSD